MSRYRRRSIVAAHLAPDDLAALAVAWAMLDDLGTVVRADPACLWYMAFRHPRCAYHVLALWLHVRLVERAVLLLRRAPRWGRGRHGAPQR